MDLHLSLQPVHGQPDHTLHTLEQAFSGQVKGEKNEMRGAQLKTVSIKGTDQRDESGPNLGLFDRSSLKREARRLFRKFRPSPIS